MLVTSCAKGAASCVGVHESKSTSKRHVPSNLSRRWKQVQQTLWRQYGCVAVCRLQQALPGAHITIYADRFGSDVTTHGAAGVWMPYKLSETPEALTDR
jgi:hypothetical protein